MRYPFGKYDQAFVPEFNAGAMENPGLVTVPRRVRLPLARSPTASGEQRATRHRPRDGAHVVRRPGHHALVGRPVAERVVRRVPGHRVAAEATRFTGRLDDFAMRPQGLGLRAPTSGRPPTRSRRTRSPTPRRRCSTSTASRTPRAPPCCASWSPGSATTAFLAGLNAHFARARVRQRHPGRPARRAVARPAGATSTGWADVWLRRPQVNTLRTEVGWTDGRYAVGRRSCRPRRRSTRRCARTGSASASTTAGRRRRVRRRRRGRPRPGRRRRPHTRSPS